MTDLFAIEAHQPGYTALEGGGSNRNLKQILIVVAIGWCISLAGYAQLATRELPNAPRPAAALSTPSNLSFLSAHDTAANMMGPSSATAAQEQTAAIEQDASSSGNVSLYTIVDLALRNSSSVRMAEAEQQRARGYWMETRDAYVPNFSLGSGLGYSYGFPLGNPTLFNANSTSLLFSFSQRYYIHSAKSAWKAATFSLKNVRRQVILDAALNYIELNKTLIQIAALNQASADADNMVQIVEDRLRAGLETDMQVTRTKLSSAQIQLHRIQMEDHADELRQHLSNLTGLGPDLIVPTASSIPPLPDFDFQALLEKSGQSPAIQAAAATAEAKLFASQGDIKQNHRPTIQLAAQYARFAPFNNYSQYYQHFNQYNNVGIGIQAVWPLFDRTRRDKADESIATAKHDRAQAELAKIQSDESNFALWHSLRELEAEEQVADLQRQLAQDTLNSTVTQMNHGAPNGKPIPPQQADQDRVDAQTSYVSLEDAKFAVTRVKLDLLSAVGDLEDWAKQSAQPNITTPPQSTH
ncbi:MAG: TolC family protein [Acidobacteriaceae bacterium]